jgi:hypothetical protein
MMIAPVICRIKRLVRYLGLKQIKCFEWIISDSVESLTAC